MDYHPDEYVQQPEHGNINTPIGKDIHQWSIPTGAYQVHVPRPPKQSVPGSNMHPNEAEHYFYYDYDKISKIKGMYASKYDSMLPAARWGPSNSIPITESELVTAQRVQLMILVALGAIGLSMLGI